MAKLLSFLKKQCETGRTVLFGREWVVKIMRENVIEMACLLKIRINF